MARRTRLDVVLRELKRRRGKLRQVSLDSTVPYTTVKNIASGRVKDPLGSTLDKLYDLLAA